MKKNQLAIFEQYSPTLLAHSYLFRELRNELEAVVARVQAVAVWRLRRRPLPPPSSRGDVILAKLIRDFGTKEIVHAVAENLDAIAATGPYEFESVGRAWS